MTKKKRELIEILLDNVKPEDWPENLPYAAQDVYYGKIHAYFEIPYISPMHSNVWVSGRSRHYLSLAELCKRWSKTIVHRDEFMKRWNERNPVVDSEGWIQWNGGEMPVEKGTLIDVKYRDGQINEHVKAGFVDISGTIAARCAGTFTHYNRDSDIVAYRLHAKQDEKTPQQLALEKFGTDWHDNEGVQPVEMGIKIDVTFNNGYVEYGVNSCLRWDKSNEGYSIEKWRIHSDEKESQINKAEYEMKAGGYTDRGSIELARKPESEIEKVISDRGVNYGRFEDGAEIMQQLKLIAHTSQGWEKMKPIQREGMDMILHKIGRILNGDPSYVDSWIDIEGYSKLVSDWLKGDGK